MKTKGKPRTFAALGLFIVMMLVGGAASAVTVTGTVESADTPDTPVSGAIVSIPSLEISATTNGSGEFDLGDVAEGSYTITVSFTPAGSAGYHNETFTEVTVSSTPLELAVNEIMAPAYVDGSAGDMTIRMTWTAPENHEATSTLPVNERLDGFRSMKTVLQGKNLAEAELENDSHSSQASEWIDQQIHRLSRISDPTIAVTSVEDLIGYRLRVEGQLLSDVITGTDYLLEGLVNGQLYSIEVAADYGYGDEALVFSTPVELRPNPQEYEYTEVEFDWIEIRPSEGGSGTPVDWQSVLHPTRFYEICKESGFIDLGDLTFEHYGVEYSSLNISERGWLSFTYSGWDAYGYGMINIPYFIPIDYAGPYNFIAPFAHTTDVLDAGPQYNVWYQIDEENQQVIIEWYAADQLLYNYFVTLFEVVLDCQNNTVTFQYNNCKNQTTFIETTNLWYWVTFPRQGIENIDGTQGLSIPWTALGDSLSYLISPVDVSYGDLTGTITDGTNPVEGAYITTEGLGRGSYTDENGEYTLNSLDRTASHTVVVRANGYDEKTVADVQFTDPGNYANTLDITIDAIGTDAPPTILGSYGYHDDGLDVYLAPPGTVMDLKYYQYDDGVFSTAETYELRDLDNGETVEYAVWYQTDGPAFVTRAMIYLNYPGDFVGRIDLHRDPITVMVRADDNGIPGELLWTSEPVANTDEDPWVVVYPNVEVDGPRYWITYFPNEGGEEGYCFDDLGNFPQVTYWKQTTLTEGEWRPYQTLTSADPMVRSEALLLGGQDAELVGPIPEPNFPSLDNELPVIEELAIDQDTKELKSDELPQGVKVTHADGLQPMVPTPPLPQGYTSAIPQLNLFGGNILGYNVYYSLNEGANYVKANESLITTDVYFIDLGSESEGDTVYVYATAVVDVDGSNVESDPSALRKVVYGMAPEQPDNLAVTSTNHDTRTVTLSWDATTTNADGSANTDLVGYKVYREGELVGEVGASTTSFTDTPALPRYYQYWVSAVSDEGVESFVRRWDKVRARVGNPTYFTSFETDEDSFFNAGAGSDWQYGTPSAGPEAAYEGSKVWATILDGDYVDPTMEVYQVMDVLVSKDPVKVTSPNAQLVLFNWVDYDSASQDNTKLACSVDGSTWYTQVPKTFVGKANRYLGETGHAQEWRMVYYDLSSYYVEGQETELWLGLLHQKTYGGEEGTFYGVAVDAMSIFGIKGENSGAAGEVAGLMPVSYSLHQNYPNPFNPTTTIRFDLVEAQPVRLTVFNSLGQQVRSLVSGQRYEAGYHQVQLDGSNMATGVYFIKLETPAYNSVKKMLLMK